MPKPAPAKKRNLKGSIEALNISPKGHYEGFLLRSGEERMQINLPKEGTQAFLKFLKPGANLDVQVEPFKGKHSGDHPTYTLLHLKDDQNSKVAPQVSGQKIRTKGLVKNINYALHGKPNGAVLDNGDFIHMKPDGAEKIELELDQKLDVEGILVLGQVNHRVIEAEKINGINLKSKPKPKPKVGPKGKVKDGPKTKVKAKK